MFTYKEIKNIVERKGYEFDVRPEAVNIIGIRNLQGKLDEWNDYLYVCYVDRLGNEVCKYYHEFTVDPGKTYVKDKLLNPKGVAIVVPGQYKKVWKQGWHGSKIKYKALVQTGAKIKVYRDNNKDLYLDFNPSTIDEGYFGINLHHGFDKALIGPNSAGCQVFKNRKDLVEVYSLVDSHVKRYGDGITYTLLTTDDI